MAGNKAGGKKAAETNYKRHGKDFYSRIGREGGRNGHTGGFYADRELAKRAGAKGGKISKRGPAKQKATKPKTVKKAAPKPVAKPKKPTIKRLSPKEVRANAIRHRLSMLSVEYTGAGFFRRRAIKKEVAELEAELGKLA